MNARTKMLAWWATATLLLLLAFGARVWDLSGTPPGLTHDEASNGHDSAAILRGVHRIYFPVGYGHEPLYNYSAAVTTALLGQSIFTLRLTTVLWGMAQIVLTAALARRWWGSGAALATFAVYAVSFWALMLARVGLRAPTLPTLLVASVLAFDYAQGKSGRTVTRRPWCWYCLSGLFLGLGFYTYMASRGMPLLYLGYLAAMALIDRSYFRRVWRGTLLLLAVAALVGAPIFLYLRANPGLEQRIGQLGSALVALTGGDFRPVWRNIVDSLPMLLWKGDPHWLYNIAGRPGLEPVLAAAFVIGLVATLLRLKDHKSILLMLWLGGGTAPALLAPVDYNLLHAVAAMPAAFLLAVQGLCIIGRPARGIFRRARLGVRLLAPAALGLAIAITGADTFHDYFVTWSTHRDVRVAYHHHVVALGRYLDGATTQEPCVITSLYPGEFHDPYTMEVTLRRDDLSLRWADGREALFFPRQRARLFVEAQTSLPTTLRSEVDQDVVPFMTLEFGEDAIPDETRGYLWDAPATWDRLAASVGRDALAAAGDPPLPSAYRPIEAPVDYGGTVRFLGYRAAEREAGSGAVIEILTLWEVLAPADGELAMFAHLLDADGTLIVQDDRLGAPSWQWQQGDRFAQLHRLSLPSALPSGTYTIALGLYDRETLDRLTMDATTAAPAGTATRLLLPIEVQHP